MQNVHFREAKFQNSPGKHVPGPPSVLEPIFTGLTLNCFRRACYYQWVITYLNYTKRCFFLTVEKDAPFVLYRDIYFKDC